MTQTLERPRVERPQVETPEPLVRWMPWLAAVLVIAAVAVALWIGVGMVDDSYQYNEDLRFEQIAQNPFDRSIDHAEDLRFQQIIEDAAEVRIP